jgi:N-acetylated-alpha-linked acidic dipeptidase
VALAGAVCAGVALRAHAGTLWDDTVSGAMAGFSLTGAQTEAATEARFRAGVAPLEISKFHRYLTAEPHPAGSPRNNELAQWVAQQWRDQGLEDVQVHEYDVLNSRPREVSLEMVQPEHWKMKLREDAYSIDPDTKNPKVDGAYLGYSASGEVTAPVVYAHSGNPEDYEYLRKSGIDVHGKIVLVRYSNPYSYRGFKALTAQREGAAAILIYSDPAEDGFVKGAVYPDGPWGPKSHIQRGAITYDFIQPGDPLTPGYASVPGAPRIPAEQAVSLPKIMGVPLSWGDAEPLLEHMDGPLAPADWQGGIKKLKYRLGGAKVMAHLKVDMDQSIEPYYVTEARIRGSEQPDEWVILGNHRDAWAYGGVDPSSGTASMLELTRGLGALLKQGVRPKRSIIVCSWDGEEYALTGSTEWGEQYADEIKQKAVAYLNVDEATSGKNFQGQAVGSLAGLLVDVSKTLPAPTGGTLFDEWRVSRTAELNAAAQGGATPAQLPDTHIGSGSDHTVFLNFLGVPTVNMTFVGPYGVYHSMYDDYFWMNNFGDPGYRYHALMTEMWGAIAMRLANADVLPLDYGAYGTSVREFLSDLDRTTHVSEHIDISALRAQLDAFEKTGRAVNTAAMRASANSNGSAAGLDEVNHTLMQVERNWCNAAGIPGRPWFKHTIYGTRFTYAHLELPGLTEAAESQNWTLAKEQAAIVAAAAAKNTKALEGALEKLNAMNGVAAHK